LKNSSAKILVLTASLIFSWLLLWPILHFHQVHVLHVNEFGPVSEFVKPKTDDAGTKGLIHFCVKETSYLKDGGTVQENSSRLIFSFCLLTFGDIKSDVIQGNSLVMLNRPPPSHLL